MKYTFYTLLLMFLGTNILQAQVTDAPISINPILQKAYNETQSRLSTNGFEQKSIVAAGKEITICIDDAQELQQLNPDNIQFGSVEINGNCFSYFADELSKNAQDIVEIENCNASGDCIIQRFPVDVRKLLMLPFLDDFSSGGPYPSSSNWIDNQVFINNTFADTLPSIGIATFDGLDASGRPYGGGYGASDTLTSTFIDLSTQSTSDDVYFSFYVARKGLGYQPSFEDFFIVEIKSDTGWVEIDRLNGGSDASFEFKSYQIADNMFFNTDFQIRFINYSDRKGIEDLWHLDYVKLKSNEIATPSSDDIAFTKLPNSLLFPYASMPWRHFTDASELNDNIEIEIINRFNTTKSLGDSRATITETTTNTPLPFQTTLFDATNFSAAERKENIKAVSPAGLYSEMQNGFMADEERLVFDLTYDFNVSETQDIVSNDTAVLSTVFHNYFAYDDGSAERAILLGSTGTQVAIEFHSNVDDSLRAIQLHFPHRFENTEDGLFNIYVWLDDLNTDPIFEAIFQTPVFTDSVIDSLQGFSTYPLKDIYDDFTPVFIPAGTFYVGIQQATTVSTVIGRDMNTPFANQFAYVKTDAGWTQFGSEGAIMIRAVMGDITPPATSSTIDVDSPSIFNLFPNPASNFVTIQSKDSNFANYEMKLYNTVGQLIRHETLTDQLDVHNLKDGIYFLTIMDTESKQTFNHKFIVAH